MVVLQRRRELLLQKQEDLRQLRLKRQKRLKKDLSPSFKSSTEHDSEALGGSTVNKFYLTYPHIITLSRLTPLHIILDIDLRTRTTCRRR